MSESHHNPVQVFAGSAWETALLKTLLEDMEIEVFLKDEIRGIQEPFAVTAGGASPIKVMVSSQDVIRAMQVVREFEANMKRDDGEA
jgi:hypothetical protein